jgi:hypothetical protein
MADEGRPDLRKLSDQVWIDAVRPTWAGELVVAHDLAEIAL